MVRMWYKPSWGLLGKDYPMAFCGVGTWFIYGRSEYTYTLVIFVEINKSLVDGTERIIRWG